MHLSPAAIESAIKLLDQPVSDLVRGDIGETGPQPSPEQLAEGQKLSREWFAAHPRDSAPSPLTRQYWIGIQKSVTTRHL